MCMHLLYQVPKWHSLFQIQQLSSHLSPHFLFPASVLFSWHDTWTNFANISFLTSAFIYQGWYQAVSNILHIIAIFIHESTTKFKLQLFPHFLRLQGRNPRSAFSSYSSQSGSWDWCHGGSDCWTVAEITLQLHGSISKRDFCSCFDSFCTVWIFCRCNPLNHILTLMHSSLYLQISFHDYSYLAHSYRLHNRTIQAS